MKLCLKILLVMAFSGGIAQASEHESLNEKDQANSFKTEFLEKNVDALFQKSPGKLELFSQAHAQAFKNLLLSEENARTRYRYLLYTAAGSLAVYLAYTFFKGHEQQAMTLAEQGAAIKLLSERVGHLEKNSESVAKAAVTWSGYFWEKTKKIAGWVAPFPSYIAASVVLGLSVNQVNGVARRIGNHLFEERTIAWCIQAKTGLKEALKDIIGWADELVAHPSNLVVAQQRLFLRMSAFKHEIEKVVGYMEYVKDEIYAVMEKMKNSDRENPDLAIVENAYKSAVLDISVVESAVNELINESNAYINNEKGLDKDREKFALRIRTSLSTLIRYMEQFESVQYSVGYENSDRLSLFEDLLALLDPEVVKLRNQAKHVRKLQMRIQDFDRVLAHVKQKQDVNSGIESFLNSF